MGRRRKVPRRGARLRVWRTILAVLVVVGAVAAARHLDPATVPASSDTEPNWRVASDPPQEASRSSVRDSLAGLGTYQGQQPPRIESPTAASGDFDVVAGNDKAPGDGEVVRYLVEFERGLPFDAQEFAAASHRILNDPRGWGHGDTMTFERVSSGSYRFRIRLASPTAVDSQCPLNTHGEFSCRTGKFVLINAMRWGTGADAYGPDLAGYREYLLNHEVGHALGHGHVGCPGRGKVAPVMMQQTKGVGACLPNPWPHP